MNRFEIMRRPLAEQERENHWSYDVLKQQILNAYPTGEGRVVEFDELPNTINLGKLGEKTITCVQRMLGGVPHREFGADITYDPGKQRLLVTRDDQLIMGTEKSIFSSERVYTRATDHGIQQTELAGFIHTHPSANPFSVQDVYPLLSGYTLTNSDGKRRIYLQILTLGDAEKNLSALIASNETTRIMNNATVYAEFMHRWNGLFKDEMDYLKRTRTEKLTEADKVIVGRSVIKKIAEEYKIGYYYGDSSGILQRSRIE
jgi:hypothetical protein